MTSRRTLLRWLLASPLLASPAVAAEYLVGERSAADVLDDVGLAPIDTPEHALTVFDFQRVAATNLPPAHYAYVNSAAGDGSTMRANRTAIEAVRLRLHRLRAIARVDTGVRLFGERYESPLFLCPVASLGSQHAEGERAVARAAKEHDIAMAMSTYSSHPIETLIPDRGRPVWFQLYTMGSWAGTEALIRRAEDAGARVMMITVDTPTRVTREFGERMARLDDRNCASCHTLPIRGPQKKPMARGLSDLGGEPLGSRTLDWKAIERIRSLTRMKIVIKGLETGEDARLARELGVDAIYVSNHGGRGIHASRGALACLPEVVDAAGDTPILIDGGFRRGTDLFKALALGATAVGIGRPYVWGLGAFGEAGVAKVIQLMHDELQTAMIQAGAATIADIDATMVTGTR